MSRLIYIHDDDKTVFNIVVNALKEHGYAIDHATSSDMATLDRIHADVALICQKQQTANRLTLGNLTLDLDNISAFTADGVSIHFTPIEFSMLSYLIKNAHRAVSRSELLSVVWKFDDDTNTRVADDTAKRLRRKLSDTSLSLQTVWNFGFRIVENS